MQKPPLSPTKINIFWFRRDLRLDDNHGLWAALSAPLPVMPVFIFDPELLESLPSDDARIEFIYREIERIDHKLRTLRSGLFVFHCRTEEAFKTLCSQFDIHTVYANHDYEPYAIQRDESVRNLLQARGIDFKTSCDQVLYEKNDVMKQDQTPYTVFTPYSRAWKAKLIQRGIPEFPSEKLSHKFVNFSIPAIPALESIGFQLCNRAFPPAAINSELIENYQKTRDFPAIEGTTKLGVHLRFGTLSSRKLIKEAHRLSHTFLNELIWREFYMMILWHYPHVVNQSFRPNYDHIVWLNNSRHFEAWCKGQTGYPFVDAGMRQLKETGYMHNRLRMITASFLSKHLLTDWRLGEAWFAQKLLDYELASNNGGWQWSAGTGCDAAPYFRIFNPYAQLKKFDPQEDYLRQWAPEYLKRGGCPPIVEHTLARTRAINAYKSALTQKK